MRRHYRSPRMSQAPAQQGQPGEPSRILPYPDEAGAAPPPPRRLCPAGGTGTAFGHQLDQQAPARADTPTIPMRSARRA